VTRKRRSVIVALGSSLAFVLIVPLLGGSASADTAAYELYCPGSPIGNLVINNVITTGTMSPSAPARGHAFSITGYQTVFSIPAEIAEAAQALGNTVMAGTYSSYVHVTGAKPATIQSAVSSFSVPIPNTVPNSGLQIAVPVSAASVGRFTARGHTITAFVKSPTRLTLSISGSTLRLRCRSYRNNALQSGISRRAPNSYRTTPVIARNT
jgi:hypothetical protein